ncbi:hypothetical protein CH354_07655 [Leptospira levettii]|uniref:restriction endonuclease subunit S n=1 Tax=Leptospira levettii TaxID=2023178 RepID=UPI000C2B2949|nr:restriction endonuclease subunit S [Leptospira levettii]PJZ36987.1 hypothetical protein CH354_07655 [Leptospira levettii]
MKGKFKESEVGLIPEDWELKTIDKLISEGLIIEHLDGNHGELYPRSQEFVSEGVPFVGATDFEGNRINFNECKKLTPERVGKFRKGFLRNNDILFAHNATVGPVALFNHPSNYGVCSTTVTCFRINNSKLRYKYFFYNLKSTYFINQYKPVMYQSTRMQVPILTQRKFYIPLPPTLDEQEAIATVLSDTDAWLESLEAQIEKKKLIKQGTMQELLTGKRRLPGFGEGKGWKDSEVGLIPEDWEVKRLGDVAIMYSGGTPNTSNPNYYNGHINWITSSDLNKYHIKDVEGRISNLGYENSACKMVTPGTVLVALYGATAGVTAISFITSAINQAVLAILIKNKSSKFLFYKLTLMKRYILSTFLQGGQGNLSSEIYKDLDCSFPENLLEQEAIANVLSEMDEEIEVLEQKVEKAKGIKQGLMQVLLTGKIRLV